MCVFSSYVKKGGARFFAERSDLPLDLRSQFGRICNPTAVSISICNALIGLKILIFHAAGLQIQPNGKNGGNVARDARQTMERRLGRSVVSPERASDYIKPIESQEADALPFPDEEKNII